jgi:hypothetical protein
MQRLSVLVLLIAVFAVQACGKFTIVPPLASPPSGVPTQIWSGSSGGFAIDWTTGDISASPQADPSKKVLSEFDRTVADFYRQTRKQRSDCDLQRAAELQSVVGSIVSISSTDSMKCTDGSTGKGMRTTAIDLAHPKSTLLLSDLFPAHELASLQTRAGHLCPHPAPRDLLSSFAFGEVHGNIVVVAVALPPQCSGSHVDLAMTIPAKLKAPLALAAQRKQGFLRRDRPAIAKAAVTTVDYHYRTSVE